MPTAGEANIRATSTYNLRSNPLARSRATTTQQAGKENVPASVASGRYRKSNLPRPSSKPTTTKPPTTKPLTTNKRTRTKSKGKAVPDFEKLHKQWQQKFQQGKALNKKGCTQVREFELTRPGTQFRSAYFSGNEESQQGRKYENEYSDEEFESDGEALKKILDGREEEENEPASVLRRNTVAVTGNSRRKAVIPGEYPHRAENTRALRTNNAANLPNRLPPTKQDRIPHSKRSLSLLEQQQSEVDIDFEEDSDALASILDHTGITHTAGYRQTVATTDFTGHRGVVKHTVNISKPKKTSIYYQGPTITRTNKEYDDYRDLVLRRLTIAGASTVHQNMKPVVSVPKLQASRAGQEPSRSRTPNDKTPQRVPRQGGAGIAFSASRRNTLAASENFQGRAVPDHTSHQDGMSVLNAGSQSRTLAGVGHGEEQGRIPHTMVPSFTEQQAVYKTDFKEDSDALASILNHTGVPPAAGYRQTIASSFRGQTGTKGHTGAKYPATTSRQFMPSTQRKTSIYYQGPTNGASCKEYEDYVNLVMRRLTVGGTSGMSGCKSVKTTSLKSIASNPNFQTVLKSQEMTSSPMLTSTTPQSARRKRVQWADHGKEESVPDDTFHIPSAQELATSLFSDGTHMELPPLMLTKEEEVEIIQAEVASHRQNYDEMAEIEKQLELEIQKLSEECFLEDVEDVPAQPINIQNKGINQSATTSTAAYHVINSTAPQFVPNTLSSVPSYPQSSQGVVTDSSTTKHLAFAQNSTQLNELQYEANLPLSGEDGKFGNAADLAQIHPMPTFLTQSSVIAPPALPTASLNSDSESWNHLRVEDNNFYSERAVPEKPVLNSVDPSNRQCSSPPAAQESPYQHVVYTSITSGSLLQTSTVDSQAPTCPIDSLGPNPVKYDTSSFLNFLNQAQPGDPSSHVVIPPMTPSCKRLQYLTTPAQNGSPFQTEFAPQSFSSLGTPFKSTHEAKRVTFVSPQVTRFNSNSIVFRKTPHQTLPHLSRIPNGAVSSASTIDRIPNVDSKDQEDISYPSSAAVTSKIYPCDLAGQKGGQLYSSFNKIISSSENGGTGLIKIDIERKPPFEVNSGFDLGKENSSQDSVKKISEADRLQSKTSSHFKDKAGQMFQDALLDQECALYTCLHGKFSPKPPVNRDIYNPIAKILSDGDDMHFVPIKNTDGPIMNTLPGSAFRGVVCSS